MSDDPHDPGHLTLEDVTGHLFAHRAGKEYSTYFDCADEACQRTGTSWPCDAYRLAWNLRRYMLAG